MRIYTHYSDGQYTLSNKWKSDTYTEIKVWQWWLYCIYIKIDTKVNRWCGTLDNRAYDERDKRRETV